MAAIPSSMEAILTTGGDMGSLIAARDWSRTPLGPIENWPQSLRTAVSVCLTSRFPMTVWWGPELVMLYNDEYRAILGPDRHPQALGTPGAEVWPDAWQLTVPLLRAALERGETTFSADQLRLLERDGCLEECYFTYSHSPIHNERGEVGGVLTVTTDTTPRVVGERRLRALRELAEEAAEARTVEEVCERAATALERSPGELPFVLLYLLDRGGTVARLAAAAGVRVGKDPVPAIVDLDDDRSGWRLGEAAHTGEAVLVDNLPVRLHALTANGRPPSRALVLPVQQPGEPTATGLLVAGISPSRVLDTDYREFCRQVAGQIASAVAKAQMYEAERRAEALAQLDRARTAFFSNVSHEFRTPLTLLLGPIEDVLGDREDPPSEHQRERLMNASRNASRLLGLVNTLLDFSRLEEGRLEAWYEPTDLGVLTQEVASAFRSGVEQAGLRYIVDCPTISPVHVDRSSWEKIVLNLISNALKFTLSGQITVRVREEDDSAVLEVRDTGSGIPQDEVPRIFDRFHRVPTARSRTHEGTGIGLALVRELVELHRGTINVCTTVGQGSCFTVSIPKGTEHLQQDRIGSPRGRPDDTELYVAEATRWLPDGPQTEHAARPHPHAGRILVADDNADMRRYVTRLLGKHWEVEAVGDGLAALAAARRNVPDLVLTDVMMPTLDGFGLLEALREDPATARIPVVMLSARAGEEAAIEGLDAGADDYLVKPFSARELVARVRANLEMSRARELATKRADEHARVLRGLAEVATVLTSAASLNEVLQAVTDQARELIGAHRAVTRMTVDPCRGQATMAVSLSPTYAICGDDDPPDGGGLAALVCRDNLPLRMTQKQLEAHPAWRGRGETQSRQLPMDGWLAAPLVGNDGQNLGLIQLSDKYEGDFTAQDLAILVQVAAVAAGRIERAQGEARVREISETLQHSLLPSRLPTLDHAEVAARYVPGSPDVIVGGDWYDVIALPGGRTLLAVGDVVGHGERAAVAMGQLRHALRAYAWEGLEPAAVLERLNRLGEGLSEQHFSTVACLCFDSRTGLLQYANAGHPPPLVVGADGSTRLLEGARGVPIGAAGRSSYTQVETAIEVGATLLLYTDGLVESRERGVDQGLDDLVAALADAPRELGGMLDHVLETVPHEARDDDIALVGLRVVDRPVSNLELRLPSHSTTLALLRGQVRDFLEQAGVPEDDAYEMIVALGEAASNAIQHPVNTAKPFIEVGLTADASEIVATVRDFGRWTSLRPDPDANREDQRGRGLPMMAEFAEVHVGEHPGGTAVTLRRPIREREPR